MDSETLRIYPGALMAVVPAAMTSAEFDQALAPYRLCFPIAPLDPHQTLAELLAANRGGRRRLRYGTIANYLRGATLLSEQGQALDVGGQTVKNVTGYALPQLLVGGGRDLGQVTSLTLTLRPLPRARRACLLAFAQTEEACAAAAALLRDGAQPNCLALLDAAAQEQSSTPPPQGLSGALLLAEYDGHPDSLGRQIEHLLAIAAQFGGKPLVQADDEDSVAACWNPWETIERWLGGFPSDALSLDLSLPRRQLTAFVEHAQALARAYRLRLLIWGDVGVGNLHPTLCWDTTEPWRAAEAYQAALLLWQSALSLGGTAAGERGNASIVAALERGVNPVIAELRARLVGALNPSAPW